MCFLVKNANQKLALGARVENTRANIGNNTNKGGKMCFLIKNTNQKLASGARVENTRANIRKNTNKGGKNLPFNIKKGAV
jgi:hypothetical protein